MRDPTLQATALRFAADDLPPEEAATFGALLATDADAQDALAEAVRLSAKALGQSPPSPRRAVRDRVRERLFGRSSRRGFVAVAAVLLVGVAFALTRTPRAGPEFAAVPVAERTPSEVVVAPEPRAAGADDDDPPAPVRTTAEIWADLSTAEHVEKAIDDELRWRQRMRDLRQPASLDARDP